METTTPSSPIYEATARCLTSFTNLIGIVDPERNRDGQNARLKAAAGSYQGSSGKSDTKSLQPIQPALSNVDIGIISRPDKVKSAIKDNLARFRIWAGNLGAYQRLPSRSSADFRLHEAPEIADRILEILEDIVDTNQDIVECLNTPKENAEAAEEATDDADVLEDLCLTVGDSLTNLLKVSALLRKATTRDRYALAVSSKHDVLPAEYSRFDLKHVLEKFPKTAPQPWLHHRLANAITQRRRYLRYAQGHQKRVAHEKATNHAPEKLPSPAPIPARREHDHVSVGNTLAQTLASTKASTLLKAKVAETNLDNLDVEDDDNMSHATSFISTASGKADPSRAQVVRLEDLTNDGEPFECPYCRGIVQFKNQRAWRKHVFRDLRAYVCTHENCDIGLFEDKQAWFNHELEQHRRLWLCLACPNKTFDTEASFRSHLQSSHDYTDLGVISSIASSASRPVVEISVTSCPLCKEQDWADQLRIDRKDIASTTVSTSLFRQHLGNHHEQLALFAISPDFERELDSEQGSQDSNVPEADRDLALQYWQSKVSDGDNSDTEHDIEREKKASNIEEEHDHDHDTANLAFDEDEDPATTAIKRLNPLTIENLRNHKPPVSTTYMEGISSSPSVPGHPERSNAEEVVRSRLLYTSFKLPKDAQGPSLEKVHEAAVRFPYVQRIILPHRPYVSYGSSWAWSIDMVLCLSEDSTVEIVTAIEDAIKAIDSNAGMEHEPLIMLPPEAEPNSDVEFETDLFMKVRSQVEYYFKIQNLREDIHLRTRMDAQGFVFAEIVLGLTRVKQLTDNARTLEGACIGSDLLEMVWDNDAVLKLRRRLYWAEFVLPVDQRHKSARTDGPLSDGVPHQILESEEAVGDQLNPSISPLYATQQGKEAIPHAEIIPGPNEEAHSSTDDNEDDLLRDSAEPTTKDARTETFAHAERYERLHTAVSRFGEEWQRAYVLNYQENLEYDDSLYEEARREGRNIEDILLVEEVAFGTKDAARNLLDEVLEGLRQIEDEDAFEAAHGTSWTQWAHFVKDQWENDRLSTVPNGQPDEFVGLDEIDANVLSSQSSDERGTVVTQIDIEGRHEDQSMQRIILDDEGHGTVDLTTYKAEADAVQADADRNAQLKDLVRRKKQSLDLAYYLSGTQASVQEENDSQNFFREAQEAQSGIEGILTKIDFDNGEDAISAIEALDLVLRELDTEDELKDNAWKSWVEWGAHIKQDWRPLKDWRPVKKMPKRPRDPASIPGEPPQGDSSSATKHEVGVPGPEHFWCNLCYADLNYQRYHCLDCADFDLCADCFTGITTFVQHQHSEDSFVCLSRSKYGDSPWKPQTIGQTPSRGNFLTEEVMAELDAAARVAKTRAEYRVYRCNACDRKLYTVRFHCTKCLDHDLCYLCVADEEVVARRSHEARHFQPMTKWPNGQWRLVDDPPSTDNVAPLTEDALTAVPLDAPREARLKWACDGCQKQNKDIRYNCQDCANFDLCRDCFENEQALMQHQHHPSRFALLRGYSTIWTTEGEAEALRQLDRGGETMAQVDDHHIEQPPGVTQTTPIMEDADRHYVCRQPGCQHRTFDTTSAFRKHTIIHLPDYYRPYRCGKPYCSQRFWNPRALHRHDIKSHRGVRSSCPNCNFSILNEDQAGEEDFFNDRLSIVISHIISQHKDSRGVDSMSLEDMLVIVAQADASEPEEIFVNPVTDMWPAGSMVQSSDGAVKYDHAESATAGQTHRTTARPPSATQHRVNDVDLEQLFEIEIYREDEQARQDALETAELHDEPREVRRSILDHELRYAMNVDLAPSPQFSDSSQARKTIWRTLREERAALGGDHAAVIALLGEVLDDVIPPHPFGDDDEAVKEWKRQIKREWAIQGPYQKSGTPDKVFPDESLEDNDSIYMEEQEIHRVTRLDPTLTSLEDGPDDYEDEEELAIGEESTNKDGIFTFKCRNLNCGRTFPSTEKIREHFVRTSHDGYTVFEYVTAKTVELNGRVNRGVEIRNESPAALCSSSGCGELVYGGSEEMAKHHKDHHGVLQDPTMQENLENAAEVPQESDEEDDRKEGEGVTHYYCGGEGCTEDVTDLEVLRLHFREKNHHRAFMYESTGITVPYKSGQTRLEKDIQDLGEVGMCAWPGCEKFVYGDDDEMTQHVQDVHQSEGTENVKHEQGKHREEESEDREKGESEEALGTYYDCCNYGCTEKNIMDLTKLWQHYKDTRHDIYTAYVREKKRVRQGEGQAAQETVTRSLGEARLCEYPDCEQIVFGGVHGMGDHLWDIHRV